MPSLTISLFGLIVAYFVGLAVYRIKFHPLAKFPGRRSWAVSQWPEALSNISGNRHIDLYKAHQRYGDVVRISPNSLSFRTAGAVRDIYADRKANLIKTGWTDAALAVNPNANTHAMNDRELHARRRRLLQFAFSENALKGLEHFILDRVSAFCEYMGEPKSNSTHKDEWSKQQDVAKWSNNLTLDVLGELCFGKSFEAMEAGGSMVSELLISATKINATRLFAIREIVYPIFRQTWLMLIIGGKTIKQKIGFRNMMVPLLQKRFALEEETKDKPESEKRKDFMHYLIKARDPETGEKFTPQDLVMEAALLVGAGSDTSSTALSGIFFYLTHDPAVLKRLQDEVRSSFDNVEEIKSGAKLSGLRYLRACIDEGLRMTPPVPTILSRRVLPGGATIDGHHLPADTVVGVPIYTIHHNETYFPEPFTYKPERWIPDDDYHDRYSGASKAPFPVTQSSVELQRKAWMPFSVGPRNCVGKNMAMMELLFTIARIMYLYDIRNAPGSKTGEGGAGKGPGREREGEYQIKDYFVADREGPLIEFKRRS